MNLFTDQDCQALHNQQVIYYVAQIFWKKFSKVDLGLHNFVYDKSIGGHGKPSSVHRREPRTPKDFTNKNILHMTSNTWVMTF